MPFKIFCFQNIIKLQSLNLATNSVSYFGCCFLHVTPILNSVKNSTITSDHERHFKNEFQARNILVANLISSSALKKPLTPNFKLHIFTPKFGTSSIMPIFTFFRVFFYSKIFANLSICLWHP